MSILSVLVSFFAFVCAVAGVLTTPIPVVGALFAFGAPALALAGAICGGVAMSRAKRAGGQSTFGVVGVVLNALVFFPALLSALTCGVCNALISSSGVQTQRQVQFHTGPMTQPQPMPGQGAPGQANPDPNTPPGAAPPPIPAAPSDANAPPPAFPPPPIDSAKPAPPPAHAAPQR